ncbi:hypothetical protein, partial [Bacteroides heparinolyticus]|uniref:hypothetical protein n=1 Tax=Prevotella heparinolytica TaxID=28113 RepID=UPI0035A133A0
FAVSVDMHREPGYETVGSPRCPSLGYRINSDLSWEVGAYFYNKEWLHLFTGFAGTVGIRLKI